MTTHIDNIIQAANAHRGLEFGPEIKNAIGEFCRLPDPAEGLPEIARRLPEITSPEGAGVICVWFGAGVESGTDPKITAGAITDVMFKWVKELEHKREDRAIHQGVQLMGQGLVAHLSRSEEELAKFKKRTDVLQAFSNVETIGVTWVLELISKTSGELMVVHASSRRVFSVEFQNISNCFHLFTLLQALFVKILPDAKAINPRVLAVALGESSEKVTDEACWHFGHGHGPKANIVDSVFGETNPAEIPKIQGKRVLLLWPMILGARSWDGGYFGPYIQAAPPSVIVNAELSKDDAEEWFKMLKIV